MRPPAPHFVLFSESRQCRPSTDATTTKPQESGEWRFHLKALDGSSSLSASDREPAAQGDRLELLAVVRGLESLDQPSRVTLVTSNRYVSRGIRSGMDDWRANNWRWERYGRLRPIRHGDLWQRIDRALEYHDVECRVCRFDTAQAAAEKMNERCGDSAATASAEMEKESAA